MHRSPHVISGWNHWLLSLLSSPVVSARREFRGGDLRVARVEACLTFTARDGLLLTEPLLDPVTPGSCSVSIVLTVPTATDWNDPCRVGLAPTETCDLATAH